MKKPVTMIAVAVGAIIFNPATFAAAQDLVVIYAVEGNAMAPALHDSERRLFVRLGALHRGDIVLIDERGSDGHVIKRVIGLPGETIEVAGSGVRVDGRPLAEPYASPMTGQDGEARALGPGEYFVMGDNRDNSLDSRSPSVGPVTRDAIEARALPGWAWEAYLAGAAVIVVLGLTMVAGAVVLTRRRERSIWWAGLVLTLHGLGFALVYWFVRRPQVA